MSSDANTRIPASLGARHEKEPPNVDRSPPPPLLLAPPPLAPPLAPPPPPPPCAVLLAAAAARTAALAEIERPLPSLKVCQSTCGVVKEMKKVFGERRWRREGKTKGKLEVKETQ